MTDLTRRKKELLNSYNNLCSCYGDIISEQTKTINQLKELLRECRYNVATDLEDAIMCESNVDIEYFEHLLTRIDNAIGEKK